MLIRSNITYLINENLFSDQFSDCLKLGIITPIFSKDGDKKNKSNQGHSTASRARLKIF